MERMDAAFTLRDWNALPEGFPAQLLDGMLVKEPSPTYGHQDLVVEILLCLRAHLDRGCVVVAPADVVLDDRNVLQPDVCVLRDAPPRDSHDIGIPILVFEVLSPATALRDRTVKTRKYLDAGVEEVWLVDPDRCQVEIRTRAGSRVLGSDRVARSQAVPAVGLDLGDLFGDL